MHAVISWNAFCLQQYMIHTRSECRGNWQLMPGDEDSPLIVVCQHQFVPVVTSSETSRLCLPIADSARPPWAVYNSCIQHNARWWDCSPFTFVFLSYSFAQWGVQCVRHSAVSGGANEIYVPLQPTTSIPDLVSALAKRTSWCFDHMQYVEPSFRDIEKESWWSWRANFICS